MNPLSQWLVIAVVMVIAMALAWTWQRRRANAGIVDVVWAAGMGASALLVAATGQGDRAPRASLAVMAGVWSLRLAWHLWRRVRQGEDGRYRALREHWAGHQGKFFGLFMFQAGLVMLFSLPFLAVGVSPARGLPVALGLAIWLAAPGRFSTTTARPPSSLDSRGCRMRARMSVLPPGGYGTTRISGFSSARAGAAANPPPSAASAQTAAKARRMVV